MTADPVVDLCLMLVEASDADRQAQSAARALLVAWKALGGCALIDEGANDPCDLSKPWMPCWRCATRNRILAEVEDRDA